MNTSTALTFAGGAPNVADSTHRRAARHVLEQQVVVAQALLLVESRATGYFLALTPSTRKTPSTVYEPSRFPGPS
jgi:hypothetical protein